MYKSEVYGKGGIYAKVVTDSIANGVRITTVELRYPRFILAEFNTHRVFSRNSSSSRAIPVKKMIKQVVDDPAMPIHWGKNKSGMQADEECSSKIEYNWDLGDVSCKDAWKYCAADAADIAERFSQAGYHKQIVNRLLEPFQFMKTVVTATEWENFFHLRDHKDSQPEIAELARCMRKAMSESHPEELIVGEWHLPYVTQRDLPPSGCIDHNQSLKEDIKCSAARCARVSYLNHDKSSPPIEDDLRLYNMLAVRPYDDYKGHVLGEDDPVHLSPLEHIATPMKSQWESDLEDDQWEIGQTHCTESGQMWSANFRGWIQYRQLI